jgi:hypothetical protein
MLNTIQPDLFETAAARSLLDQLLIDSRLYKQGNAYKDLLDFVVRLRNFAPFNAMLLQVQKPGLSYAASARDWRVRFGRLPKEGARPLLILWPFGPVALVYDVLDTEGRPLPEGVNPFAVKGSIDGSRFADFERRLLKKEIQLNLIDAGDNAAGSIRVLHFATSDDEKTIYRININRNHALPVQFTTLLHELGHLFLGHLGPNKDLTIPLREALTHQQQELEAESVAYLTCHRNGVTPNSESYLANFVATHTTIGDLDLYQVMRAAGQVESILRLSAHSKFR